MTRRTDVPTPEVVLAAIGEKIDPSALITTLEKDYTPTAVVEAIQRCFERDRIIFDANAFLIPVTDTTVLLALGQ